MNVIFVCTGNTCRSPMAEGFFKKLLSESGLSHIQVCSRGIAAMQGSGASINSVSAASELGADISSHISTQLTSDDIQNADLILTMTNSHASVIKSAIPEAANKVFPISQYVDSGDISDPYGGTLDVYRKCAGQIMDAVKKIYFKLSDSQ